MKFERIEIRATGAEKKTLIKAAKLSKQSMAAFILSAALSKAKE